MNSLKDNLEKVLNEILTLSEISKKSTVFTIGIAPRQRENKDIFFPFIRESTLSVIGNVEVTNIKEAKDIVEIIDTSNDLKSSISSISLEIGVTGESNSEKQEQIMGYLGGFKWSVNMNFHLQWF